MKRSLSVKKNSKSQVTYRNGTSCANKLLVMYMIKTGEEENRTDVSVSKEVDNSVIRHHIIRLLRRILRLDNYKIETGSNIILVARGTARQPDCKHLEGAYLHLYGLHHILKELK